MADEATISAGKELIEIALDFERLSKTLLEVSNKFQKEAKIMEQKSYYDGRNRENLDVANYAASNHIQNLTDYYSMCYGYVINAYNKMVELDEELANAIITAYIGEHHVK